MADTREDFEKQADEYYEEARECFDDIKVSQAAGLLHNAVSMYKKAECREKVANSLNMLGVVYAALGDGGMSMDCYIEALDIALENGYSDIIMLLYNNIGSKYQEIGRHDKAIVYFKKSILELKKPIVREKKSYYRWLLFSNLNLCISYTGMGEYDLAEKYLNEALAYSEIEKDEDSIFFIDIAQAQLFWDMGREDEVRQHVDELVEGALAHVGVSDYVLEIKNLCNLFMEMGEFDAWAMVVSGFERNISTMGNIYYRISCVEMWMKYYRAIGEVDKYNELCIQYVNLHIEQENYQTERMCEMIDLKLELQEKEFENKKVMSAANTDRLTGFGNRYMMLDDFENAFPQCTQNGGLTIGIVDIDFFKAFNKTNGRMTSDDAIKIISDAIRNSIDGVGQGYRFNGDEFYLILKNTDKTQIKAIADRISETVKKKKIINPGSKIDKYLTVSQAYIIAEDLAVPDEYGSVFNKVDTALDSVKENGRNAYIIDTY